jgi:methionyl-tRNA formyltransferase
MKKNIRIGFFGGPEYSVIVLEKLQKAGFDIACVVTSLDKPKGRNLVLTPPPAKVWSLANNIPVIQPTNLRGETFVGALKEYACDVFIVMAFGRIIPDEILNIPLHKSLNIHPSLLPKFRGPCPIESAILADEKETGVTIIRLDSEMDHGPIIAAEKIAFDLPITNSATNITTNSSVASSLSWPPKAHDLGVALVEMGSDLLVKILPDWILGKIEEVEQDHSQATYTKKITKEDGLINLADDSYKNYLKIQAYHVWPSAYFFAIDKNGKRIRVKITKASYDSTTHKLIIEKVIPEGRGEMDYSAFSSMSTV